MRKNSTNSNRSAPKETKAAEAVTVAWMLTLLCTVASLGLATLLLLSGVTTPPPDAQPGPISALPNLLFFVSLLCSVLCLVLTWFTGRLRKLQPPRSITIFAILAGAAPWVILVIRLAMG